MLRIITRAAWVVAAAVAAAATPAMSVEQVVAKHVQAHGGRQAWEAIQSMRITGEFTAFSQVKPFTLHRKRDYRYHMDHHLGDKLVVIGYDGRQAWWDNRWLQEDAQPIEGADLEVLMRDVDWISPLFDYEERGFVVELIGKTQVEGVSAIGLELERSDDSAETWYLDPTTYLALARDSPGSDFGQPMRQRTWFDDYREVDGVMIPHFTETQWYTRDRVMQIERIETNVDVDDALFPMPVPAGMGPLQDLIGTYDVAVEQRQQPGAPWSPSERESTIDGQLRGALLQEHYVAAGGTEVLQTLSYDRFREIYRMTRINGQTTFMDVMEGGFEEDGRLVLTNLETGTTTEMMGMTIHARISISDITREGFKLEQEVSIDGGESWFVAARSTYARREEG